MFYVNIWQYAKKVVSYNCNIITCLIERNKKMAKKEENKKNKVVRVEFAPEQKHQLNGMEYYLQLKLKIKPEKKNSK